MVHTAEEDQISGSAIPASSDRWPVVGALEGIRMGHSTVEFQQPDDDQMTETLPVPQNDFEQLRRPRSLKMSEQVARQTVDYIIANGLGPGTRLPVESELGKLLGIGRNTLREALRLLEA